MISYDGVSLSTMRYFKGHELIAEILLACMTLSDKLWSEEEFVNMMGVICRETNNMDLTTDVTKERLKAILEVTVKYGLPCLDAKEAGGGGYDVTYPTR